MSLRTLLLATYHFPPSAASGSFRLLGFAQHLLACGWRTVVVAPPRTPYEPVDERLSRKVPPETVIYSVPFPRGNKLTRKFAPFGVWLPAALRASARAVAAERPDALLTSSPPHLIHLLGRVLKARYGMPWIVDYRDPWVFGLGELPGTWQTRWEAFKEKVVLKKADAIVANTPLARIAIAGEVPQFAHKMFAITNGFDPENFPPSLSPLPLTSLAIVHTGELYTGRDPRPLFDALVGLSLPARAKPLKVTFIGQSSDPRFDWPGEVRRRGLENVVEFTGHVRYDVALSHMQRADILLLLDSPGRRVGIPAKLFEYFGAGRPILALAERDGDIAWALKQCGVQHRLAPPTDPGAIRAALTELIDEITSGAGPSQAPRPEAFTRAHMAAQLAHILDQAVTASRRGSPNARTP